MAFRERMTELMKKYGKVALGVHLTVSTASITGLYVAIKNNVDVESIFQRIGLSSWVEPDKVESTTATDSGGQDLPDATPAPTANRTAAMVASSGGALALALLCNKALFPVRVPITIALTPPIARYLARRRLVKT